MADRTTGTSPYRHGWMERSTPRARRAGQAIIEYTILLVMLASITIGVMVLAGHQLGVAFNDVKYDIAHYSDPAPVTVAPHTCSDGTTAVMRHNKWRCEDE